MADRVLVRRMAAAWAQGTAASVDAQADIEAGPDELAYQLWPGDIDVEPLGVLGRREVTLTGGVRASLVAVSCGHVIALHDPATDARATVVVAAVDLEAGTQPLVCQPATGWGTARTFETGSLRLRAAVRIVDATVGRQKWLTGIASDPGLCERVLAVSGAEDPSALKIVLWAPPAGFTANAGGGRVVLAAHIFAKEGRMLLTETAVRE